MQCLCRYHPCMAIPVLEGLLSHYQSLGVTTSTWRTYQTGFRTFQQFCFQFRIPPIPASPLIPWYFCCWIVHNVLHKTIKVYLADNWSTQREAFKTPSVMSYSTFYVKASNTSWEYKTNMPTITINILRTLKCKLREKASCSLIEKRLLWSAFTLAF